MKTTLPRRHQVLAAHDASRGPLHTLTVAFLAADAPVNRASMRAQVKRMPRFLRQERYGFGWDRGELLPAEAGWPDAEGRARTEPKKAAR